MVLDTEYELKIDILMRIKKIKKAILGGQNSDAIFYMCCILILQQCRFTAAMLSEVNLVDMNCGQQPHCCNF